jgi:hypothetical protein
MTTLSTRPSPPATTSILGWDVLLLLLAVAALLSPLACRLAQALPAPDPPAALPAAEAAAATQPDPHSPGGNEMQGGMPAMRGMNGSMAHEHMGMGAHMKMTAPRPPSAADQQRAGEIVRTLRVALARYRDYHSAIADGYQPFLPQIPQPMYHFTNWVHGFEEAFNFDPQRPTSLLYEKTADGYRLKGAMFTTPKGMSEEELDSRVPLSVTSWHQHVNICLPKKGQGKTADWTKFGFAGAIATTADCAAAGGDFHPVIFGWMVHVYPYETDPAKIWAH